MKTRKVSKKRKDAWRKHIDVSDVDAYLEEKRFVERSGKPVEIKTDAELFKIDTKPKSLIKESVLCPRPKNIDELDLKCFRELQNSSAVPDPVIKRNAVRTKEQRKHPTLLKKNEICLLKGFLKKEESNQLQTFFHKRISCFKQKSRRRTAADKDLWSEETIDDSKLSKVKPWLSARAYLHTIRNTGDLTNHSIYRPEDTKTFISPFEAPHPGSSYNPTFQDHLDLANNIEEKEINTQKEETRLTRATQKLYKQVTASENEKNWIEEMSEGLPLISNNEIQKPKQDTIDADSDNYEYRAINSAVSRDDRKTRKQKNKQLRLKQEELKQKQANEQKKKSMDICRVNNILQEIEKDEIKKQKRTLKRLQKSSDKFNQTRRIGKNKFEASEPAINCVTELTGSLREVMPQGNVLKDKLLNMQKRNLIEITKPQFKSRKKKVRKYRLASHRPEPLEFTRNAIMDLLNNK